MEIELVPDPGADDPAARAAVAALVREGLADEERPAGSVGAWRRAGLEEAVERSVMANGHGSNGSAPKGADVASSAAAGYVPPPRSSRGATRA